MELAVTDEMVRAFGEAWHATPPTAPGDRRRAGIAAVLALVRQAEPEPASVPLPPVLVSAEAYWYRAGYHDARDTLEPAGYQWGVMWTVDEADLDVPGERMEWHETEARAREVASLYRSSTVLARRPVYLGPVYLAPLELV